MALHLRSLHYVREPGIPGGGMPEENAPSESARGVLRGPESKGHAGWMISAWTWESSETIRHSSRFNGKGPETSEAFRGLLGESRDTSFVDKFHSGPTGAAGDLLVRLKHIREDGGSYVREHLAPR